MTINKIVAAINAKLAGELYTIADLTIFIDSAIDDINTKLNTCFPVLSEMDPGTVEYTAIPDKYIRSVVIPGAAFKFYTMDEEGISSAPKYEEEFIQNLFYMERDYLMLVPEEFLADMQQGTYTFKEAWEPEREVRLDGGVFFW